MANPLVSAALIFDESRNSLMAHTIRGAVNHFRINQLELDVRVVPDTYGRIRLEAPGHGVTSILRTRLMGGIGGGQRNCVVAWIYIHPHANKHLARICVAHEVYHLLIELEEYIRSERREWKRINTNAAMESECNQFAWQLCKYHDIFNRDEKQRHENIYFPEHLFDAPLKTSRTSNQTEWPIGICLDAQNPFHKRPPSTNPHA